jgi:hypothetical protein
VSKLHRPEVLTKGKKKLNITIIAGRKKPVPHHKNKVPTKQAHKIAISKNLK